MQNKHKIWNVCIRASLNLGIVMMTCMSIIFIYVFIVHDNEQATFAIKLNLAFMFANKKYI